MKRHDQVSYILIGLAFCAFLVANIAQPIDWEASWGTILLFTFFLALAGDLGITPRTPHHAMLHVVALTALLIVGLASA
jgi:peptidoglycan/LPS O-acetylase OafA/YrhL